ncbi:helicase ARIP4-like [Glandiceps talaboti]
MEVVVPLAMDSRTVTDKNSSGEDIQNDFLHFVDFISSLQPQDSTTRVSYDSSGSENMPPTSADREESPELKYVKHTNIQTQQHGTNTSMSMTSENIAAVKSKDDATLPSNNLSQVMGEAQQELSVSDNDNTGGRRESHCKRKRMDESKRNDRIKKKKKWTSKNIEKDNPKRRIYAKKLPKDQIAMNHSSLGQDLREDRQGLMCTDQETKDESVRQQCETTLPHPTGLQALVSVPDDFGSKERDDKKTAKRKPRKRKGCNATNLQNDSKGKKGKAKKKKRKKEKVDGDKKKKKKKKSNKPSNQRRNIKKLLKEEQLKAETKAAQLEEQKRLMDLHKSKGTSRTVVASSAVTSDSSSKLIGPKTCVTMESATTQSGSSKASKMPTVLKSHTVLTKTSKLSRDPDVRVTQSSSSVRVVASKSVTNPCVAPSSSSILNKVSNSTVASDLSPIFSGGVAVSSKSSTSLEITPNSPTSPDIRSKLFAVQSVPLSPPAVLELAAVPPTVVDVAPLSHTGSSIHELDTTRLSEVSTELESSTAIHSAPTIEPCSSFGTSLDSYATPSLTDSFELEPSVQRVLTPSPTPKSATIPESSASIDFTTSMVQGPIIAFTEQPSENLSTSFPINDGYIAPQQCHIPMTALHSPLPIPVPAPSPVPITPSSDNSECIVIDSDSDSNEFLSYDMGYNGNTEQLSLDEIENFIKECCETYTPVPSNGEVRDDDDDDDDDDNELEDNGLHTNDDLNQRDILGRVLLNPNHPFGEQDVFLAPQIARHVKPHQIGGIRFLYDNIVGSIDNYESSGGFGCILAHSMGLGKTLQVISFIDIFLRHTSAKRVLCIVPVNTIRNWCAEFEMWSPPRPNSSDDSSSDIQYREFDLYVINECHKTAQARTKIIGEWQHNGGVLLMGYEMYRLLVTKRFHRRRRKARDTTDQHNISPEEERRRADMSAAIDRGLLDPGPDLVICDEGHRIKNINTNISRTLKNIRTRRRIVLTGYPLQNNLLEYWCMVDFVRPNFLGTKAEFSNLFERPIVNGQCRDSTPEDIKLMQYRVHVLYSQLKGFVQRRSHVVLKEALPQKEEHVVLVRLSHGQRMLYNCLMRTVNERGLIDARHRNPIKVFSAASKIWNHPDLLYEALKQKNEQSEKLLKGDVDPDFSDITSKPASPSLCLRPPSPSLTAFHNLVSAARTTPSPLPNTPSPEDISMKFKDDNKMSLDWAIDVMSDYTPDEMANSGKMMILFYILEESIKQGEKVLVFSQSLNTLSLIEKFLGDRPIVLPADAPADRPTKWIKDKSYYRLDGGTVSSERAKMINHFNSPNNTDVLLFLLSTRAGCLGVNLVGANRVIVYDASWNPCHDAQAVCRVYRYGQSKKCHVYRLVSENTMEKKIFDRQISKQGMSDRVVDEQNPELNLTKKDIETLLKYDENDAPYQDFTSESQNFRDPILANLCTAYSYLLSKAPFTHESLLIDREELKLTRAEKKAAKQNFRAEKR